MLARLFEERRLPANIFSDNGVPFASAHALESSPAYHSQVAQSLDTQAAFEPHPCSTLRLLSRKVCTTQWPHFKRSLQIETGKLTLLETVQVGRLSRLARHPPPKHKLIGGSQLHEGPRSR